MEPSSFRRRARARVDDAIRHMSVGMGYLPGQRLAFANLVHQARTRSSLLEVRGDGSTAMLALEALANLAAFHREFREWPGTWAGGEGDVYTLVHSLASHLFARYPIPRGFSTVWYGGGSAGEREERRWVVDYGEGRRFRAMPGLPIALTRKMERILLSTPPHLRLRPAIRRAEILALGGTPELVDVLLLTRLATEFDDGEFWREAIAWFVRHWAQLSPVRVTELVELLSALRADGRRSDLDTSSFSLTGRTPESLDKLLRVYKRDGLGVAAGLRWSSSGIAGLEWRDEVGAWAFVELTSARALEAEGRALRHCVAGYWVECLRGRSSIWSLRVEAGDEPPRARCTIEALLGEAAIVQIRGYANRKVRGRQRAAIERWAAHAGLEIRSHAW